MKSIRTFLVVVILSVVCLSNFTAALRGYQNSLNSVDRIEEKRLLEKLGVLEVLLNRDMSVPDNIFEDTTFFQIWKQGVLVAGSKNSPLHLLCRADGHFHLISYLSRQWLLYCVNSNFKDVKIVIGTLHRAYFLLTEEVLLKTIAPIIWILPLIGMLVWVVVNVGTKPIKRLADDLAEKKANDFSAIARENYAGELLPIVDSLNGLLTRLKSSFERERRFSADAAHELRTPLSALNINLHNLSHELKDQSSYAALKRVAARMEHSIEQLLALHRVSLDADYLEYINCNLHTISQNVIANKYDDFSVRQQSIELKGSSAFVFGNPSHFEILLNNLLDNASKYTPHKGAILIEVWMDSIQSYIRIEDSGSGIDEEHYSRVLEPFYRIGGDRHDSNVSGSGLGLSIVSNIVSTYEGAIDLCRSEVLGGLSVTVSFPSNRNGS